MDYCISINLWSNANAKAKHLLWTSRYYPHGLSFKCKNTNQMLNNLFPFELWAKTKSLLIPISNVNTFDGQLTILSIFL